MRRTAYLAAKCFHCNGSGRVHAGKNKPRAVCPVCNGGGAAK